LTIAVACNHVDSPLTATGFKTIDPFSGRCPPVLIVIPFIHPSFIDVDQMGGSRVA
jgi:hypothetical protein